MESDDEFLNELSSSQRATYEEEDEPAVSSSPEAPDATNARHPTVIALKKLAEAGTTLENVLEDIMFGDIDLQSDPAVLDARRRFFASNVLNDVLTRIRKPPGMRVRGASHQSTRESLEQWALDTTQQILCAELADYAKTTKAPGTETEVVNEDSLKSLTFESIMEDVKQHAPKLFELLCHISTGPRSERNKHKDPSFCITIFLNAMAYQLSRFNNRIQKLLCIYFKAKGVPKSCYYLFQKAGIVTSYEWSTLALNNISKEAMAVATELFLGEVCISMYDNIRLAFAISHQRINRLTVTDNGTAMTIIRFRDAKLATSLLRNREVWEPHLNRIALLYRTRKMPQLDASHLFSHPGYTASRKQAIGNIISFLFDIPELRKSQKRSHPILTVPSVHQLPYGPEHTAKYYMLESVPMEEQTYNGNYAITKEILRQLSIDNDDKIIDWATENVTPWVGDALTVNRLRILKWMKCGDANPAERLSHIIPVFGWFHLDMNLCNAIFYHQYMEDSSSGLHRDATALKRSGLKKPSKKQGAPYHILNEFLRHSTTARMRELWIWVTGCNDTEDLVKWVSQSSPQKILENAIKIWEERASIKAIKAHEKDSNLVNSIILNRDLLLRHEVKTSMQTGDVGRMENTLPHLLFFFLGAGASNYAREISEVLHWRQFEAPPNVWELIRNECWVLNTRGKHDTFYAFDLRQELNNLAIKEHGPPPQGCTWDSHRKWAPALPVLSNTVLHMDKNFHELRRSRKHYVPDPELDIKLLITRHTELKIHEYNTNRKEADIEKLAVNCMDIGRSKIMDKAYLQTVAAERTRYLSHLSTLNLNSATSIEDAIHAKVNEWITDDDVGNQSNINTDLDASTAENDMEEDLFYGYDLDQLLSDDYMVMDQQWDLGGDLLI